MNLTLRRIILIILFIYLSSVGTLYGKKDPIGESVFVLEVSSSINPATADYIVDGIERAEAEGGKVLVLKLDTPGGLDHSMRSIIKRIMNSNVPVVVYVSPRGARAASAGVLITLASDVAAMAPGTSIGAAHPVSVGGGKMGKEMAEKIANDAAAYARSIAEKRGRNPKWAEEAVRKSSSLTEREALEKKVIDMTAIDLSDLLTKVDGWRVKKGGKRIIVKTMGAPVQFIKMGFRHKVLNALSDPNIAYILLMLGIFGIFFEFSHPGALFPGLVGGICIILGFYALHALSVNSAGFLLIALAFILFILEIKVQSYGMLSVGGIVSLLLGSIMLFRTGDIYLRISMKTILSMGLLSALFFGTVTYLAIRAQRLKPRTGFDALVGQKGKVLDDFEVKGRVIVAGEIWEVKSTCPLKGGEEVEVTGQEGFLLKVKPKGDHGETPPESK